MSEIYKHEMIKGGRYSQIFALIRVALMDMYESKHLLIENFMTIEDALKEMESVLKSVAKEANA